MREGQCTSTVKSTSRIILRPEQSPLLHGVKAHHTLCDTLKLKCHRASGQRRHRHLGAQGRGGRLAATGGLLSLNPCSKGMGGVRARALARAPRSARAAPRADARQCGNCRSQISVVVHVDLKCDFKSESHHRPWYDLVLVG